MAAIERITRKVDAYRNLARPAPTPEVEISGIRAAGPVLGEGQMRAAGEPTPYLRPYINARGETTGTVVNTTA